MNAVPSKSPPMPRWSPLTRSRRLCPDASPECAEAWSTGPPRSAPRPAIPRIDRDWVADVARFARVLRARPRHARPEHRPRPRTRPDQARHTGGGDTVRNGHEAAMDRVRPAGHRGRRPGSSTAWAYGWPGASESNRRPAAAPRPYYRSPAAVPSRRPVGVRQASGPRPVGIRSVANPCGAVRGPRRIAARNAGSGRPVSGPWGLASDPYRIVIRLAAPAAFAAPASLTALILRTAPRRATPGGIRSSGKRVIRTMDGAHRKACGKSGQPVGCPQRGLPVGRLPRRRQGLGGVLRALRSAAGHLPGTWTRAAVPGPPRRPHATTWPS